MIRQWESSIPQKTSILVKPLCRLSSLPWPDPKSDEPLSMSRCTLWFITIGVLDIFKMSRDLI